MFHHYLSAFGTSALLERTVWFECINCDPSLEFNRQPSLITKGKTARKTQEMEKEIFTGSVVWSRSIKKKDRQLWCFAVCVVQQSQ